jgi:hypothetical protein
MRAVSACPSSWNTTQSASDIANAIPKANEPKLVMKRNKRIRNEMSTKMGIPNALHIFIFEENIRLQLYQIAPKRINRIGI